MPSCAEAIADGDPSETLKRSAEGGNAVVGKKNLSIDSDVPATKRAKSSNRTFPCPFEYCGRTFYRPSRLQEHLNSHTGEVYKSIIMLIQSSFECDKCEKSFKKASRLAAHRKTHLPSKTFKCSFPNCTVACTTAQHLKAHELIHATPNPYQVFLFSAADIVYRLSPLHGIFP
jgi:uncharacterized Zn-finger protein